MLSTQTSPNFNTRVTKKYILKPCNAITGFSGGGKGSGGKTLSCGSNYLGQGAKVSLHPMPLTHRNFRPKSLPKPTNALPCWAHVFRGSRQHCTWQHPGHNHFTGSGFRRVSQNLKQKAVDKGKHLASHMLQTCVSPYALPQTRTHTHTHSTHTFTQSKTPAPARESLKHHSTFALELREPCV